MEFLPFILWVSVIPTYHAKGDVIKNVDFIENEMDWKTASEKCVLYGSSETEDFQKIILNTTIASQTLVWIAATPIYTPWVKLLGCSDIPSGTKMQKGNGTLKSCLVQCNRSKYVGLKGSHCYCLDTKPSTYNEICIPIKNNTRKLMPRVGNAAVIYAVETRTNSSDNESWRVRVRNDQSHYSYAFNQGNSTRLSYVCRVEWVYGLSQYRFIDKRLTFEQAKGRCQNPNSPMHNGEDFPVATAWISSDWNMVTLKWGVDESMIGSKQCVGAMIENNRLKPRLLNCNRKLKSLCEPGMLKVTTEPKPEDSKSEEAPNNITWYIVIGGLGVGIIVAIVVLIVCVRKKKQARLQNKLSVTRKLLVGQNSESTTQAYQPDMDYSEIDGGNNENKQEEQRHQEEEGFYNEVDTNKEYAQVNKMMKQTNILDDEEYNELTFKTERTTQKVNIDDTYDHMPKTIEEATYDHCGEIKNETHTEDFYDSVEKKDGGNV